MIRTVLLSMALTFAGLAQAAPPASKDEVSVDIISAEFGIFDASTPGELAFEPADVVPHRVGQRYGWSIEVRTTKRSLAVREEYLLPSATPAPVATDPLSASLQIPSQRRNQVSQRQLVPVGGRIYGEWAIGPLEPAGRRHLQVVIEGKPAASFEYEVK